MSGSLSGAGTRADRALWDGAGASGVDGLGEYRLKKQKIYAFVGVLGYSRWLYLEYVESMAPEVLIACHRRMFAAFGGVPREVLYDNMKTVVSARDACGRGRHRFHKAI